MNSAFPRAGGLLPWLSVLGVLCLCLLASPAQASDAVCAEVRIEIRQKLNLERQAFDAVLRIRNGLASSAVSQLSVNVLFTDELGNPVLASSDPNNTSALFFVRLDGLEDMSAVDGTGEVLPGRTGVARWLIIPSANAGGSTAAGRVYRIGARVEYRIGDEERVVEVIPETITVRPQPRLVLDYFLAGDVYSDDPFTPEQEPAEPFTFGVRVRNAGAGPGRALRIESAQPRIVENELGLLVDFRILGGFVDDAPAAASLRLDLGDLPAGQARMGRWLMETSLSGQFVDIEASYTHADTLGGALTSLIEGEPRSHLLVRDVLVDLPGRDGVRDFLALNGDILRVYESSGLDTEAQDVSAQSSLSALGAGQFQLQMPSVVGFAYARMTDPTGGAATAVQGFRADGSTLPAENVWFSRVRDASLVWRYYVHVFDARGGGSFSLRTDLPPANASLGGRVYLDGNGNGAEDPGEPGLAGVALVLDGSAAGAIVQRSSVTAEDGSFSFGGLPAGSYSLAVGEVAGLVDGLHQVGTAGGQVQLSSISGIQLPAAMAASGYRFAKREPAGPRLADLQVFAPQGPDTVAVGEVFSLAFRATNLGPEGSLARSQLQFPEGFEVVAASASAGDFDAASGLWQHGSLAAGAEQSLLLQGRLPQAGDYSFGIGITTLDPAVVDPEPGNNSAQRGLRVEAAPGLRLQLALASESRVLVWAECPAGAVSGCADARRSRWQTLLQGRQQADHVALDAADFQRALRLGDHNLLLIDGPLAALQAQGLSRELSESLRRGQMVLLSGAADAHWQPLLNAGALGAYTPREGGAADVEFLPSAFFEPGPRAVLGPLATFDSAGATVLARLAGGEPMAVRAADESVQMLALGFDLLSLMEAGQGAELVRLLTGTASAPAEPYGAGRLLPLVLQVQPAEPGALAIDLGWPAALALAEVSPPAGSSTAQSLQWQHTADAALAPFRARVALRAGVTTGLQLLLASAQQGSDSDTGLLELQLQSPEQAFQSVRSALDAIDPANEAESSALAAARAQLLAAEQAWQAGDAQAALQALLQASVALDGIAGAEARVAQRRLAELLGLLSPSAVEAPGESIFRDGFEAR